MLRKLFLATILTGAAALAGCGHDDTAAELATATPGGYGFHYLDEGVAAKLAYGEPNSDNIGLMFLCEKGSRQIEVSDIARSSPAPTLTLVSDGRRSDVPVEVQAGLGTPIVVGLADMATPALAGFRQSGRIEVAFAGLQYGVSADPNERPAVERFFAECGGAATRA